MKKETKVVALALVLLLLFLSGFGLGATKGINFNFNGKVEVVGATAPAGDASANATTAPAATQAPATTAPPATDAPTTAPAADATTAPAADATTAPAADATTAAPAGNSAVPSSKAEIAAAYNKAVNDYKAYTGKVTLKKHDIINVQLKDLPAIAEKIITPVVTKLTTTNPEEYTFENGVDVNDPNRKLTDKIIPGGRNAEVSESGLVNATATSNADGGYTMVLTFIAETSNFDGTQNTSLPVEHQKAMDPLNLGSLDLGPISISNAALSYPGATVTATVDGQGRLVKLEQKLPLEGEGTGKAGIELTLKLAGSMDGTYEMTYA